MDREGRVVLYGDVNIPEVPFERVPGVNGVCSGGVKHQVNYPHGLVDGMYNRQPYLRNRLAWIGAANRVATALKRIDYECAGRTKDRFCIASAALHQRAIAQNGS